MDRPNGTELPESGPPARPGPPGGSAKGRGFPGNRAHLGVPQRREERTLGTLPPLGLQAPPPHPQGPISYMRGTTSSRNLGRERGEDEAPFALQPRRTEQGSERSGRLTWKQRFLFRPP